MQAPREFWGVEVKGGQTVKVGPKISSDGYSHISQVALGKARPSERVVFYVKNNEQNYVLGTLSKNKFPQIFLDIVLDKEYELFHNSENATVHVSGYKVFWDNVNLKDSHNSDNVDNENDVALEDQDIAKVKAAKGTKYGKTVFEIGESSKQVKIGESSKQVKIGQSSKQVKIIDLDKYDDVSSDEDDSDSFNPMDISDEESESYEVSDWDEEDEYTSSKKVGQRKKRPNKSASKTSVSSKKAKKVTTKKAKKVTTKKADGKKGVRTATSRPTKKGGKTLNNISKVQTPNSRGGKTPKNISKDQTSDSGGEKILNNSANDQAPNSGGGKTANNISKDQAPNSGGGKSANNISKDQAPDFGGEETPNNISKDQTSDSGEKRNYIDLNETYEEQLSG